MRCDRGSLRVGLASLRAWWVEARQNRQQNEVARANGVHGPSARTGKAQEQGTSVRHQAVGFMFKILCKGRVVPWGFQIPM